MFCFCIRTLPSPTCCFHGRAPHVRSMHQRYSSRPSAILRKMRSPQTIGVDPDHAGRSSFHVMFSVFDQRTGRFFSPLRPFADGPRHCGQFSARGAAPDTAANESRKRMIFFVPSCLRGGICSTGCTSQILRARVTSPGRRGGPTCPPPARIESHENAKTRKHEEEWFFRGLVLSWFRAASLLRSERVQGRRPH